MDKMLKIRAQIGQCWYNLLEDIVYIISKQKIDSSIEYVNNIKYGNTKYQTANILFRKDLKEKVKPVFIYIHGGGFISGKKNMRNQYVQNYAKLGFFVYSIDYTISPQAVYPVSLQDCFNALDYLVSLKDEYKIDLSYVVIAGESAGGYYITQIASLLNDYDRMNRIGITFNSRSVINIKAIVSICGAFNIQRMTDPNKLQNKFPDIMMMNKAFVGKNKKELYSWLNTQEGIDSSPIVNKEFPPIFVIWAIKDWLRYESFDLIEELKENGIQYDQFKADKEISMHAWAMMTQFKTANECLIKTLDFILPFFNEYFVKADDKWSFKI
ncbi:MAG: alpha/beta hydrolase [Clostridia bacterium]|nr:alpha/beta hydrolase [Clostridia bacterium]